MYVFIESFIKSV